VGKSWRVDETYIKIKGKWKYLYRAVDKAGQTVDFLLRAHRDKAAAQRYFEKSIDQNGEPETITIDKSGSNLAALEALNAQRDTPIKIRQNKYLNNIIEVRHEVAYRSCSHFSRYRRSEPPVSPGESRSLNQERL
jgi:putative transposase